MSEPLRQCLAAIEPQLKSISHRIGAAPLDAAERWSLSLSVAGYFFGVAIAVLQQRRLGTPSEKPTPEAAREVADHIVAMIEQQSATLS